MNPLLVPTKDKKLPDISNGEATSHRKQRNLSKTYRFEYSERCNMCGAGPAQQFFLGRRLDSRQGLWPRSLGGIAVSVYRCKTCGLLYPNPMPVPESLEQHYDVAPEDYWPESYFHVDPTYLASHIATFARLSGREPRSLAALDIGAGIGKGIKAFETAGFDTYGIEPSPTFRRAAIERMGVSEDRLRLASVESAEFSNNSFHFINFAAVLEHVVDPADALRRTVAWLKPGGLMYVEVPSSNFLLSRLVRMFYRLTGSGMFVINTCPMHCPYHLYEFGIDSFHRCGTDLNFTVARHEYYPCAAYMPTSLVGPFNSLMQWTGSGMQLAVWLRKNGIS